MGRQSSNKQLVIAYKSSLNGWQHTLPPPKMVLMFFTTTAQCGWCRITYRPFVNIGRSIPAPQQRRQARPTRTVAGMDLIIFNRSNQNQAKMNKANKSKTEKIINHHQKQSKNLAHIRVCEVVVFTICRTLFPLPRIFETVEPWLWASNSSPKDLCSPKLQIGALAAVGRLVKNCHSLWLTWQEDAGPCEVWLVCGNYKSKCSYKGSKPHRRFPSSKLHSPLLIQFISCWRWNTFSVLKHRKEHDVWHYMYILYGPIRTHPHTHMYIYNYIHTLKPF